MFDKDPSEQNAKRMKQASYSPFFILLLGIYSTILFNKAKSCVMKSREQPNGTENACVYIKAKE